MGFFPSRLKTIDQNFKVVEVPIRGLLQNFG